MKLEQIVKLRKNSFGKIKKPVELADYPWDDCIADQTERYGDEETAKRICGWIKANYQTDFAEGDSLENACWPGYIAIGTKEMDGRVVPNCVPEEKQSKQDFVIPSPEGGEDEPTYISRCISDISDEYDQEGQAYAVCKGKWDEGK